MAIDATSRRGRPARRSTTGALAFAIVCLTALPALAAHRPTPPAAPRGFHVSGTQLLDANNKPFVIRGINLLNAGNPGATAQALDDIAKTAANAVRLTVTAVPNADGSDNGSTVKDLTALIAHCKRRSLVCIFVDQDTSGYGESGSPNAITLTQAVDYWRSVKAAFKGQEAYTLIDIGNLPYGSTKASEWPGAASSAVAAMRAAGLRQTLLVTGPDYGEDISGAMRTNAPRVFAADPQHNTVFSVCMYASYYDASHVKAYVDAYIARNLPLAIGEFSWAYLPWGVWNASSGGADGPDEASIMSFAQQHGIGWNAYSWSGSSTEKSYDDMVLESNAALQTPWYGTVVTGANGLKATSHPASVFGR